MIPNCWVTWLQRWCSSCELSHFSAVWEVPWKHLSVLIRHLACWPLTLWNFFFPTIVVFIHIYMAPTLCCALGWVVGKGEQKCWCNLELNHGEDIINAIVSLKYINWQNESRALRERNIIFFNCVSYDSLTDPAPPAHQSQRTFYKYKTRGSDSGWGAAQASVTWDFAPLHLLFKNWSEEQGQIRNFEKVALVIVWADSVLLYSVTGQLKGWIW